jgi:hypothetical protein
MVFVTAIILTLAFSVIVQLSLIEIKSKKAIKGIYNND